LNTQRALAGWLTIAVLTLGTSTAQAAETWTTVKAAYEAGRTAYQAKHYADAVVAFEAAYKLRASPGLLVNLAESHKRLGDCVAALTYYDRFTAIVSEGLQHAEVDSRATTLRASCPAAPPPAAVSTPLEPAPKAVKAAAVPQQSKATVKAAQSQPRPISKNWQVAAEAGISLSKWGDASLGTHPSVRLSVGQAIWWSTFGLSFGLAVQWSRLQYKSGPATPSIEAYSGKTASSWETLAQVEARLKLTEWLTLRAELAGGVTVNSGFEAWNELGTDGAPTNGVTAMTTGRGSLGVEIPLGGPLGLRITPVALSYSPAPRGTLNTINQTISFTGSAGLLYAF
jgi:hypothetical protein